MDYFLWAIQRCFEKGEHRYLDLIWPKVGLILDRDDMRKSGAGEYFPRKRPIRRAFEKGQRGRAVRERNKKSQRI